jgi:hypothetical protein
MRTYGELKVKVITIKLLDFVHRPDFYTQKTQRFGNWICFRLQARGGAPPLQKNQQLAFPQAMPCSGIACGKASFWWRYRGMFSVSYEHHLHGNLRVP